MTVNLPFTSIVWSEKNALKVNGDWGYHHCSTEERKSFRFGRTRWWV